MDAPGYDVTLAAGYDMTAGPGRDVTSEDIDVILEDCLNDLVDWETDGFPGLNVSAANSDNPHFGDVVNAGLQQHGQQQQSGRVPLADEAYTDLLSRSVMPAGGSPPVIPAGGPSPVMSSGESPSPYALAQKLRPDECPSPADKSFHRKVDLRSPQSTDSGYDEHVLGEDDEDADDDDDDKAKDETWSPRSRHRSVRKAKGRTAPYSATHIPQGRRTRRPINKAVVDRPDTHNVQPLLDPALANFNTDLLRYDTQVPHVEKDKLPRWIWKVLRSGSPAVEWINFTQGTFKVCDQHLLGKMWGKAKNNDDMTYDKFSRALRYHYKRGEFEIVRKKLVYKFGPNSDFCKWRREVAL